MSYAMLAKRSGVGARTLQRVFSDEDSTANLRTVLAIADALDARLLLSGEDINVVRHKQAQRKATKLVKLVQGTSALESQAIDPADLLAAEQRTVRDLLSSGKAALWHD